MRSLFDQYEQPENRLTHALVSCLAHDPRLLRAFVHWVTGKRISGRQKLEIVEQTLPGENEGSEDDAERRGLPDAWIHDGDSWSLIVESKVSAAVSSDQLHRHRAMALKRGFSNPLLLVISPRMPAARTRGESRHLTWSELYEWLVSRHGYSEWAQHMVEYMEAAEERMTASGYLSAGTLTRFSGIHFDTTNPYSYREARRLLRLAMDELRKYKHLQKMGMDPNGKGRPAITGREGSQVWDFLPLKHAKGAAAFTQYPHLTVAIKRESVLVIVTVPNGIRSRYRRHLLDLGRDGFKSLFVLITADLNKLLRGAKGAKPWMEVIQRHFPSQRSSGILDCRLEFDPRTAVPPKQKRKQDRQVKFQPQWLDVSYDALAARHSNMQFAVGAVFPYGCPILKSRQVLDYVAGTWLACAPLLRALLKD